MSHRLRRTGINPRVCRSELLGKGDEGNPVQYNGEGVSLSYPLLAQNCTWQLSLLAE